MLRLLRCVLVASWLVVGCGLTADLVHAQAPADDKTAAEDRAESFRAVSGAVKEDIAGGPLMLAAYAVVWIAVFGYVYRLVRLHRNIEDSIARVEQAVAQAPLRDAS